jgi:hypothetical protein
MVRFVRPVVTINPISPRQSTPDNFHSHRIPETYKSLLLEPDVWDNNLVLDRLEALYPWDFYVPPPPPARLMLREESAAPE